MFEKLMADYCRLTYVKQWNREGSRIRITLPWAEDCYATVTPSFIFKEVMRLLEEEVETAEGDAFYYGYDDYAEEVRCLKWADNVRAVIRQYKNWWYKKEV